MKLQITGSSLPTVFPVGVATSLSNNGSEEIRLLDLTPGNNGYYGSIEHASIQFHADDEKTSIQINGYCRVHPVSEAYHQVTLYLE